MASLTDALIARLDKNLDAVAASAANPSWAATFGPSIENDAIYSVASSVITFPGQVSPSKAVRDMASAMEGKLSEWGIDAALRLDTYAALKAFAQTPEAQALEGEEARALKFTLRDARRSGLDLPPVQQEQLRSLLKNHSLLGIAFTDCLDGDTTTLTFPASALEGLAPSFVSSLQRDEADGSLLRVTMKYPDYFPIMQDCKVESTRKAVEKAFNTVCGKENTGRLNQLVTIRSQIAKLLGYDTWSAYQLETLMAKSPDKVLSFLTDLSARLAPLATAELAVLLDTKKRDMAARQLPFTGRLRSWDMAYYQTRVEEQQNVDQQALMQYFPLKVVQEGMMGIYEEILNVKFSRDAELSAAAWAPDISAYRVQDAASGKLLGVFYVDMHPRDGKYGHAAMFPLQPPAVFPATSGPTRLISVCALVTNFPKNTPTQPSLMRHSDVETLFHEMGHVMHQMLGHTRLARFAGTNVETDFVEAPSQMLENWCWEASALKRMSGHWKTGAPLPDKLIASLVASKLANGGIANKRQLALGIFDQRIHTSSKADTAAVYRQTMAEVGGVAPQAGTYGAARFGHMVGYDSKYYGYMWSKVFSADMFYSRFLKEGIFSNTTGGAYRREVIGPGGSRDASESLRAFLGRDPTPDAFMLDLGLGVAKAKTTGMPAGAKAPAAAAPKVTQRHAGLR